MPREELPQSLMPSILDRLIDPGSSGTRARPGYTVEDIIRVVRRDLEDLLNTRHTAGELTGQFAEVRRSIAAYGLPDLTSLNVVTPQQRQEISRTLEKVIATFEPRLKDVRAKVIDVGGESKDRNIRFHIDAKLAMDPAPAVGLEAVLELGSGHYSLRSTA